MVKTIITIVIAVMLLVGGAIYETDFVHRQFDELHDVLEVLYDKIEDETAVQDDVYSVQNNWIEKKKYLHVFIPHNDIKEIDLWIAESATLVRDKEWKDAISKVEVLLELTEQIPKTFIIAWENIL